jgi:type IV pilus assembly protein PilX
MLIGRPDTVAKQRGITMFITLIVLVPMMLAAIALTRSVDTAGVIMGNLAFKQSATRSADCGIETAIAWLQANNGTGKLYNSAFVSGYAAIRQDPVAGQTWDSFWTNTLLPGGQVLSIGACPNPPPATGNRVSYAIQRLCNAIGNPNQPLAGCSITPGTTTTGNSMGSGAIAPTNFSIQIYYRITARVDGPRNTVSYVQVIVAM